MCTVVVTVTSQGLQWQKPGRYEERANHAADYKDFTCLFSCHLSPSYPENGVVEMRPTDVRPRARTLLRWDQLKVGLPVMINYNLETPEERGFWFDAVIQTLTQTSRTNKELRVKILLG